MSDYRSNSKRVWTGKGFWVAVMLALLALRCEETRPPRQQPENVLVGSSDLVGGTLGSTFNVTYSWVKVSPYRYSLVPTSVDPALVVAHLTNNYDEVLQDSAYVVGTLSIWDRDNPTYKRTIDLSRASISPSPTMPGHLLTVLPGASVALTASWDHKTDTLIAGAAPKWFWEGAPVASVTIERDRRGFYRYVKTTEPIRLAMQSTVQVFARAGRVTSPVDTFAVTYKLNGPWEPPG